MKLEAWEGQFVPGKRAYTGAPAPPFGARALTCPRRHPPRLGQRCEGDHVYHLSIGLFLGLALTIRAFTGRYTAERHLGVITVGYFWYWMALMPVLVWIMMAVLPPKL